MTEQGKPLSRRDRRAMEARAAGAAPDPTESLESVGDHPSPPTDGLSRRDRRRIERTQRPMETWTAEEEMIATGQLPAMTPDVIAEQERIAQEKSAEAAADAAAAAAALGVDGDDEAPAPAEAAPPVRTSAFGRVADGDVDSDLESPASEVSEPDVEETATPAADESEAIAADEPETPVHDEPEAIVVDEPETPVHNEPEAIVADEPETPVHDEPEATVADEPETPVHNEQEAIVADQPETPASEDPESDVAEPDVAEHAEEPEISQSDYDSIPEAFRGMFPPGSLQARAMAARAQEAARSELAPATLPRPEHDENYVDPAEEIRRLTAAAMASIEGTSFRAADPSSELPTDEAEETSDAEAPSESSSHEPAQETSTDTGADAHDDHDADTTTSPEPPTPAPHHASFDEVIAVHSGELPLVEQTVDLHSPAPRPADSAVTVAPSIWDAHPLNSTTSQSRELDDAPSQAIPRPDFSKLTPAINPGHPAPFSPEAYASGEAPLTTGSIEVARRKVPELHPAGGARHFRWAHIAVLGAIAFVLGVLVYNLVGQAS